MTLVRAAIDRFSPKADAPTMSRTTSSLRGSIPMIGTRGIPRHATYRLIYRTNPWVFAAVNKLSRDIARCSRHTYQLDADAKRTRLRGDIPTTPGRRFGGQALDALMAQPDPNLSGYACWFGTCVDKFVHGNALWGIDRAGNGGAPTDFPRISWRDVVNVRERADHSVIYYEVDPGMTQMLPGGKTRKYAPDEVVHFGRGTDPDSAIGMSPLEACRYTIALYEGIVRHLVAYFQNQARPSGVISAEGLTRETAELIRELIEEAYTSPENAGRILVTSGTWSDTSGTPDESKVIDLIHASREEVAAVYGVPPPVLGILDQAIKSNVKELREQYVREGVGPPVNEFESEIIAQVVPLAPSWRYCQVRWELAEQLRPDAEAMAGVLEKERAILTIDEERVMIGKDPLEIEGVTDVPWVASGALPITRAAEQNAGAAGFSVPGAPADDQTPDDSAPAEDDEEDEP